MFGVMNDKDFFLNNKSHIRKIDPIFKTINAKCIINRSIKFC